MNRHPSRPRDDDDDPTEATALARVNAIRAARGLEPIVERDPNLLRRDLIDDRDAAMIAVAVLRREGAGFNVPDAIDAATAGFGPEVFDVMPHAVAVAIRDRLPTNHRPAVIAAVDEVLERFENTPAVGRTRSCVCTTSPTPCGPGSPPPSPPGWPVRSTTTATPSPPTRSRPRPLSPPGSSTPTSSPACKTI